MSPYRRLTNAATGGVGRKLIKIGTDGIVTTVAPCLLATDLLVSPKTGKLYGIARNDLGIRHNLLYAISETGVEAETGTPLASEPTSLTYLAPDSAATLAIGVISRVKLP